MLVWCNGGTNYLYHTIYEREIVPFNNYTIMPGNTNITEI